MSEHTTGELIQLLENFKTESLADWIVNVDVDVFIEKLQAADRLCEAANYIKTQWLNYDGKPYDVLPLIQAIAEYEGKEKT